MVNHSLFLKLGLALFSATLLFSFFYTPQVPTAVLLSFTLACVFIFIALYLQINKNKTSSASFLTTEPNVFNNCPIPIIIFEKKEQEIVICTANKACQLLFAKDSATLTSKPVQNLFMHEDEPTMITACNQILNASNQNSDLTFSVRGLGQNKNVLKLTCITKRILINGQSKGICYFIDKSKNDTQYMSMQTQMKEGHIEALTAGIAHDFRNILTSIIGSAQALQISSKDAHINSQLAVIIEAGERGSSTITEMLNVTKDQAFNKAAPFRDIREDIQEITSLLRLQLPTFIKLSCHIEDNLPSVKLSRNKLEQILMNLVNNASQAMDKEVGTIALHVKQRNKMVEITVSDNGCGIRDEDLPCVTDNFWTSRKDTGGTGLGLAMVKLIMTQHDGSLNISSQQNLGTQVSIAFPATEPSSTRSTDAEANKKGKKGVSSLSTSTFQAKPCVILLVDDQPSVLHVQQMLLEAMGHNVYAALSGAAALAAYETNKKQIQMLITDFKMPDMDGIDLAAKLREKQPNLPLLMVTGYGEKEKLTLADKLNMTIILKPTNLDKFSKGIIETQLKHPDIFS